MKNSQSIIRLIAVAAAIVVALALGLGLGLGLKKDSSSEVVPTYKLVSDVKLDGLTAATFTDEPKLAFRTGMATTLDVDVSEVTITSAVDDNSRRRSLIAAGLKVTFEVNIAPESGESTDSILATVAAVTQKISETPLATIVTVLQKAFDTIAPSASFTIIVTTQPSTPSVKTVITVNGITTTTTVCGTNQRVASGACVACSAGQSNKAGDDPAGADTLCDAGVPPPPPPSPSPPPPPPGTYCAANYHVVSNACIACAAGTRRNAGDSASGGDTTCFAISCAQNEHVVNNACVACAAG